MQLKASYVKETLLAKEGLIMPSIKSRVSDLNAIALVAAAESGQLADLQQLLLNIDPNCQTVVHLPCKLSVSS